MEAQKVTELTIEDEDKEHLHLPALGLIVFGEKSVATNLR